MEFNVNDSFIDNLPHALEDKGPEGLSKGKNKGHQEGMISSAIISGGNLQSN